MRAISRVIAVTVLFTFVGIAPADAWWRYAEWGLSEGQIMTASGGRAVPCRAAAGVCAPTSDGGQPRLFVESLEMVGMPASVSFVFDAEGRLSRTIVLFPNADYGLICNLLQGIHGQAIDDRPGQAPVKVWQDIKADLHHRRQPAPDHRSSQRRAAQADGRGMVMLAARGCRS
jgi:hypothetical protein